MNSVARTLRPLAVVGSVVGKVVAPAFKVSARIGLKGCASGLKELSALDNYHRTVKGCHYTMLVKLRAPETCCQIEYGRVPP